MRRDRAARTKALPLLSIDGSPWRSGVLKGGLDDLGEGLGSDGDTGIDH